MVGHARRFRRCLVTAEQFRDARVFAGLSRDDAADLLGISKRTVGHWETAKARPSYAAFKLLRLYRHGDLLHPDWSEYRIARNGALVTPEGRSFFAHEIGWLSLLVQRARLSSVLAKRLREGRTATPTANGAGATVGAEVPACPTDEASGALDSGATDLLSNTDVRISRHYFALHSFTTLNNAPHTLCGSSRPAFDDSPRLTGESTRQGSSDRAVLP